MAAFPFDLVSPEKLLFSGEVEAVVAAGIEGMLDDTAANSWSVRFSLPRSITGAEPTKRATSCCALSPSGYPGI